MTTKTRRLALALLAGVVLIAAVLWLRPAPASAHPADRKPGGTLRVRVWEPGGVAPTVNVNVPVVVVSAALRFASMTGVLDHAIVSSCGEQDNVGCPHFRGADLAAIWGQIVSGAPLQIVDVDDGAGGRVQVRID